MADDLSTLTTQLTNELAAVKAENAEFKKSLSRLEELLKGGNNQPPFARDGESILTSRGYSFLKAAGVANGHIKPENAKVEADWHNRLHSMLENNRLQKAESNSFISPFALSHLAELNGDQGSLFELNQCLKAGVFGYDPDEVNHYRRKYGQKSMSWVDDSGGGALVGPPQFGDLITLLRNNEALLAAGAREVAFGPNGRFVYPRHTDATSAYWIGENTEITGSQPTVADMTLTAKKLGVLVTIPNELFRFASISAEMFVRQDMAKTLTLKMDKSLLENRPSAVAPTGLIYSGIPTYTAGTTGNDGDTFEPEDFGNMIATVEEANAQFKSWILRPLMYSKLANRRADAVSAGDKKGPWLFNMFRAMTEGFNRERGRGNIEGYPAIKTTQVSNTRTKGSGTNLSYILGGDFDDFVIAMSGVMEFVTTNAGSTLVKNDQTMVRGILFCDAAVRRTASFLMCDQLLVA